MLSLGVIYKIKIATKNCKPAVDDGKREDAKSIVPAHVACEQALCMVGYPLIPCALSLFSLS